MTLEVRPLSPVVQVEGSEPAVLLGEALLLLTKPQARRGHSLGMETCVWSNRYFS